MQRYVRLFIALIVVLVGAVPQYAEIPSNIEIVLDASYTMNERTDSGKKKLDVAKEAIARFLDRLDGECNVALRAYGHMALRILKDCTDSELLVPFAPVSRNKDEIDRMLKSVCARGVTPLSVVLSDASEDFFGRGDDRNAIILIGDGAESCQGDPCGIAAELSANDRSVIVMTIGFRPGDLAAEQLWCVAEATGGRYYGAQNETELEDALKRTIMEFAIPSPRIAGEGQLRIKNAEAVPVTIADAVTGKILTVEAGMHGITNVPSGIYTVSIGNLVWKSVMVSAGRETVLAPGRLHVANAWKYGHRVAEWESKNLVGTITPEHSELIVLPGDYEVMFGLAHWRVNVPAGKLKSIKPGVISVENVTQKGVELRGIPMNTVIGGLTRQQNWMPLPPGEYSIFIKDQCFTFFLKEDQRLLIDK